MWDHRVMVVGQCHFLEEWLPFAQLLTKELIFSTEVLPVW